MIFPKSNLGIIEFEMKPDKNGYIAYHYCAIANWRKQTVIDSWDGKEKFWLDIGEPVAWKSINFKSNALKSGQYSVRGDEKDQPHA